MWGTGRYFTNKSNKTYDFTPTRERSRSVNTTDSREMLESHRLHRQQFLLNRLKFEHPSGPPATPPPTTPPPEVPQQPNFTFEDIVTFNNILNELHSDDNLDISKARREDVTTDKEIIDTINQDEKHTTNNITDSEICKREVEEPLCTSKRVYRLGSELDNVLEETDIDQPPTTVNDLPSPSKYMDFVFGDQQSVPGSPTSKAYVRQSSRLSLQDPVGNKQTIKWERCNKSVKDIAASLSDKPERRSYRPTLTRRSSMSAIPVKQLAMKFSSN